MDENVHRFVLSAIRGELLERGRERERKNEIYSFWILYTDYLLSIVKKERERVRDSEREKERERK